ncbi:MAG: hypothetical protein WCF30_19130 [Terracidiphilus sp.]
MAKYEVVEIEKNAWHGDWTPIVSNRWPCENETDALVNTHLRRVGAEIQGRTDVYYEAREDGEPIDLAGWEVPDDDFVFGALALMGYTEEEIISVLQ